MCMVVLQKNATKSRLATSQGWPGLFEFPSLTDHATWSAEARVHTPCLSAIVFASDDVCLKISNSKAFLLD